MQKVGSVTETADQNAEFTNGNIAQGVPPTILEAAIFNTWQREMVNIVESAGIALDPQDDGQILKAIQQIVGAGRYLGRKVFTSNGNYIPSALAKSIRITMVGGGGGAGGCQASANNETYFGAGGGAGATIISTLTLTGASNYPVVIGSGGIGGLSASNGSNGGSTTFSNVLSAPGGEGGGKSGVSNTNGGAGGVATTGDIRLSGGYGGDGQSGLIAVNGQGGASYFGGGGRAGAGGGVNGAAPGSGGGGAYDSGYSGIAMKGGDGASGIVIIEEFS
ncbi:Uncharacterised protein [Serratia grimesii]|nr:Uncharacterised protein [Serratia grimesii]